jgi:heptosyltransferase-2/heptosyltransferase-3
MEIACLLFRRVGDSLLAIPALRALRASFPTATLTVFAESQVLRVFQGLPHVSRIVDCGKSASPLHLARLLREKGAPDVTLDFLSDPRSAITCYLSGAKSRVGIGKGLRSALYTKRIAPQNPETPIYSAIHKLRLAEAAGAAKAGIELEFALNGDEIEWANKLWTSRDWTSRRVVAIFPTSRRAYKCWPPEKFSVLFTRLDQRGQVTPVLIGAGNEEAELRKCLPEYADAKDRIVLLSGIGLMAATLKKCDLLIGNDGGPKHLACAIGTPTITIFRSDLWQYWTPPNDIRHAALADYDGMLSVDDVLDATEERLLPNHG